MRPARLENRCLATDLAASAGTPARCGRFGGVGNLSRCIVLSASCLHRRQRCQSRTMRTGEPVTPYDFLCALRALCVSFFVLCRPIRSHPGAIRAANLAPLARSLSYVQNERYRRYTRDDRPVWFEPNYPNGRKRRKMPPDRHRRNIPGRSGAAASVLRPGGSKRPPGPVPRTPRRVC